MTARPIPPAQWTDARQVLGLEGEHAAMAHIVARGWVVEAHRYKAGRQEVDLVARREAVVAFIEVKTRRGLRYGSPAEAVGWRKRQAIARVASIWALRNGRWGDCYRFDVIEVLAGRDGRWECRHIEDAWRPSW